MNFFFLKLIIWNIDIHTCLSDSTFLCPHLFEGKKDVNQCIYIMIIIFSVNWILIITNKQNHLDVIHLFKLKNTERWKENENYVKQTLPFCIHFYKKLIFLSSHMLNIHMLNVHMLLNDHMLWFIKQNFWFRIAICKHNQHINVYIGFKVWYRTQILS